MTKLFSTIAVAALIASTIATPAAARQRQTPSEELADRVVHHMGEGTKAVNAFMQMIGCPNSMKAEDDNVRISGDLDWRYEEDTDNTGPQYYSSMSRQYAPSYADVRVTVDGYVNGNRSMTCKSSVPPSTGSPSSQEESTRQ